MAAARIQCWAILLSAYNYTLKYHKGIENSNANVFSQFPSNNKDSFSSVTNKIFMTELIHAPVNSNEVGEFSKRDPIISNVVDYVLSGWSSKVNQQFKPYLC